MSNRSIKKVAVLGSGVMGSRIACHFAGIGLQVLLLDIAPAALTDIEKAKGLTLDHPAVKNRVVNEALATAIKSNPSPVYYKDVIKKIFFRAPVRSVSKLAGMETSDARKGSAARIPI